jgi:hypothetical protein
MAKSTSETVFVLGTFALLFLVLYGASQVTAAANKK